MATTSAGDRVSVPGSGLVAELGRFVAFCLDVGRALGRRPTQWRETIEQTWFIASVSILPAAIFSFAFGGTIAVLSRKLLAQFGAASFTGSIAVLATVREAGPIIVALLISGAAGTAVCADLGARTIREEISAMEVLGVDPLHRLVVPRVIGTVVVAFFLSAISIFVGIAGGYVFNVILQAGQPGEYIDAFGLLARQTDLYLGVLKGLAFGVMGGLVACYKGLNPGGGPQGVGNAVNESVVYSFVLLFIINTVLTVLYFAVISPQGL